MPISNYPFGWGNGVAIRGLPILNTYGGSARVVFVDSSIGHPGNPGTPLLPVDTVANAIKVISNTPLHGSGKKGDIIAVNPYHAETLSASTSWNLQDVAIIGLSDAEDDMPTFTLTTAAGAGIVLAAAGMMLSNIKIVDNQGVTVALKMAAKGQVVDNVKIIDGSASFTTGISVVGGGANLADRCQLVNNNLRSAGATNGILLNEVADQLEVSGNDVIGSYSAGAIESTAAVTNIKVRSNNLSNSNASGYCIQFTSASATGMVNDNRAAAGAAGFEVSLAAAGMVGPGNLGSNPKALAPYNVPIGTADEPIALISAIKALPQSTTATVLTITGGYVVLEVLAAEVTTAVQAQANNTKFTFTDTASSTATDLCAVTSISGLAVGTLFLVKGDAAATALQTGAGGIFFAAKTSEGIILAPGTVVLNCAASNTGNYKLHVRYRPIQPGAYITLS